MWIGFIIGLLYCVIMYKRQGEPPRISPTCGPFHNGMIYIRGRHIHHWMIMAPLTVIFTFISLDVAAFCAVLTVQGLSYRDKCHSEYIEVPQAVLTPPPSPPSPPVEEMNVFSTYYVPNDVYI